MFHFQINIMRILIIEDEIAAAQKLRQTIAEIHDNYTVIGPLHSIRGALEWFKNNKAPDIILMDIELSDGNSFEILRHINIPSAIIFTTSYDAFALQAFSFNSIDYLLKPVSKSALEKSLIKLKHLQNTPGNSYPRHFLIRHGKHMIPVNIDHIAYFSSEDRLSILTTIHSDRYIIDHTITELEEILDMRSFFRANRSVIVHHRAVKSARKTITGKLLLSLNPPSRKELFISRERTRQFRTWLDQTQG